MDKTIEILEFLKFSEKIKTQKRSVQKSDGTFESVSDHSWHLALMVLLVAPHLKNKIDLLKSLKMTIIHDLVEAEIGDLPYYDNINNSSLSDKKELEEKNEIQKINQKLLKINKNLANELYSLWYEYKKCESNEALFVKALDSLEANFQSIILGDISYWGDIHHEVFLNKADKYCKHEKILENLNTEITKRMKNKIIKIKDKK